MSSWDSEKNCLCFLCIQSAHNSILVFLILTPFYSLSFYTNQNPIKMVTIFSFVPRGNLQHFTMMFAIACMCPQSFLTLCNPMDCSHQAPLSMGFPRQEYCSGLPFPSPGDLPDPGIEPRSPILQADSLPLTHQRSPNSFLLDVIGCIQQAGKLVCSPEGRFRIACVCGQLS